jgi:hypothetical protein
MFASEVGRQWALGEGTDDSAYDHQTGDELLHHNANIPSDTGRCSRIAENYRINTFTFQILPLRKPTMA